MKCRSCKADVIWAMSENGRSNMPVQPDPNGNIILVPSDDPRDPPIFRVLKKDPNFEVRTLRYISHFVTCPDAKAWREGTQRQG